MVGLQPSWGLLGAIWNQPSYAGGRERLKKEASHPTLVGGSFTISKRNLHRSLMLGNSKMSGYCTHPPNLNRYKDVLTGFSHVSCVGVLNTTYLLEAVSLDQPLEVGKTSRPHNPRTGEWVRSLRALGFGSQVAWRSCLLSDVPRQICYFLAVIRDFGHFTGVLIVFKTHMISQIRMHTHMDMCI